MESNIVVDISPLYNFDGGGQATQSLQNRKFVMSLQYLKKEVKDEVDFLHADKHQSFLKVYFNTLGIKVSYKVNIIIINGHDQAFSNYSK